MRVPAVAALGFAWAMTVAHPAAAQRPPSIDARTWRPSPDPQASALSEPVDAAGLGRWNVAAFTSYARDPVVFRSGAPSPRPVEDALTEDVAAGFGFGTRVELGGALPWVLWQHGTTAATPANGSAIADAASPALGDASLRLKATLLPNALANDDQGLRAGLGLAGVVDVSFPTGDRSSFAGEGAVTASLRVLADYALGIASIRASLGVTWRPDGRTWSTAYVGGSPDIRFGNSVPWMVAVVLRPKALLPQLDAGDRQIWELGAHGWVPAGPVAPLGLSGANAAALSPALVGIDDRIAVGHYRDAYVIAGAEFGADDAIGVPVVRGWLALGWAPRNHDRDGDGVPDDVDQCPDLPEDKDGIQDADGCPEDDADGDGVLDTQDACPLTPGPASTDPRTSGCPQPGSPAAAPSPSAPARAPGPEGPPAPR